MDTTPKPDANASPAEKAAFILSEIVRMYGHTWVYPSRRQRKKEDVRHAIEARNRHQNMDYGLRKLLCGLRR